MTQAKWNRHILKIEKMIKNMLDNPYVEFFGPLLWPRQLKLRALVFLSCLTVLTGLAVNLCVPIWSQRIVDILTLHITAEKNSDKAESFYNNLGVLLILKLLQGVGTLSLLNVIENTLWIKLGQNVKKEVQLKLFAHIHKMSVSWQISQNSGDIIGALERGSDAAVEIMEKFLYSIFPTIANVFIAILFFCVKFNWVIGSIILLKVLGYTWTTLRLTAWRARNNSSLNKAEDEQSQRMMESLLNFETVKLFTNEEHETQKYQEAIERLQKREFSVLSSINLLQLVQLAIVNVGLVAGSLITIWMILEKQLGIGDYVLFSSYMAQLILPLNYLGTDYRMLNISIHNLNNVFEILQKKHDPDLIPELSISNGDIEFRDIDFKHTEAKSGLNGLSLRIPGRKTIALVGESGAGKSSLIRLLTKVVEPNKGSILIDGQNLTNLNTKLIRRQIGVVPQDTVLFHDTIKNNIKYAKLDASDFEIQQAAKNAKIHDKIMSLPEKYEALVGERGMKLSGGEKQRISIARLFLKNPSIILLDEATSALDPNTESEIMASLDNLCRNRTTIIVTHRLQSISHVDIICVLLGGRIIERGTHSQLIQFEGEYWRMWNQQRDICDTNPSREICN